MTDLVRIAELQRRVRKLEEENVKLREVIATHELCHDSDLKVGKRQFFMGCLSFICRKFDAMTTEEILDALDEWRRHVSRDCMKHDPRPDPFLQRTPRIGGAS